MYMDNVQTTDAAQADFAAQIWDMKYRLKSIDGVPDGRHGRGHLVAGGAGLCGGGG